MRDNTIIEIKNLNKTFGEGDGAVVALDDISLEIGQGEIFGIIGLSGAGKSTLVRCINLLERPTAGSVIVDGQDLTSLSERELRRARQSIGMIFQGFNLLMQRTALENVCFPLELRAGPAQGKHGAREGALGNRRPRR
jgi:D-methionine transport system ATP-binding protein